MTLAPWPACEVRLTLASQLADTDTPQAVIDPAAPKVGDEVQVGIESPGFASYLYAAYFSADGSVVSLTQPSVGGLKAKAGAHASSSSATSRPNAVSLHGRKAGGRRDAAGGGVGEAAVRPGAARQAKATATSSSACASAVLAGDAGRVTATVLPVTTTE